MSLFLSVELKLEQSLRLKTFPGPKPSPINTKLPGQPNWTACNTLPSSEQAAIWGTRFRIKHSNSGESQTPACLAANMEKNTFTAETLSTQDLYLVASAPPRCNSQSL